MSYAKKFEKASLPKFGDILNAVASAREAYIGDDMWQDKELHDGFLALEKVYVATKMLEHLGAGDKALTDLRTWEFGLASSDKVWCPGSLEITYKDYIERWIASVNDGRGKNLSANEALIKIDAAIAKTMGVRKSQAK